MPDVTYLRGILYKGKPCWSIRTEDGKTINVVGDLSGVRDGAAVYAFGQLVAEGFCGASATLALAWISEKYGGGSAIPSTVIRDVEVVATLSSADLSPELRLEGQPLVLQASSNTWKGQYGSVSITGKLDVFFSSEGWPGQRFAVSVTAFDPTDATKKWSHEFEGIAKKGYAVVQAAIDVGAAPDGPMVSLDVIEGGKA